MAAWQGWQAARQRPFFLLVTSATLALGMAAFVAALAMVDALVIGPPPFRHHAAVVVYGEVLPGTASRSISPAAYEAIGLPDGALSRGLARPPDTVNVVYNDQAFLLHGQEVDAGFLPTLGVTSIPGVRVAVPSTQPGMWVSRAFWQHTLGGHADVRGDRVIVNGNALPIIGILPADYRFMADVDLLLPWASQGPVDDAAANLIAVARLAKGADRDTLGRDVVRRVQAKAGAISRVERSEWFGATRLDDALTQEARPVALMFLGCAVLLLVMTGANVSNLMHARAFSRARDGAIREALGASEAFHWLPPCIEAAAIVVLALWAGSVMGTAVARLFADFVPDAWRLSGLPIQFGWRVHLVAAAACVTVVALATLSASRRRQTDDIVRVSTTVTPGLSAGRGARRIRGTVLFVQGALAMALILPATGTLADLWRLDRVPRGFDTRHALAIELRPDIHQFPTLADVRRLSDTLQREALAMPGVESMGLTTALPAGITLVMPFKDDQGASVMFRRGLLTPGGGEAMGLQKHAGRWFSPADSDRSEPVAIVNEAWVAVMHGKSLGAVVQSSSSLAANLPRRVVGIVADTFMAGEGHVGEPAVFIPLAQAQEASFAFTRRLTPLYAVFRGASADASHGETFRRLVQTAVPGLAPGNVRLLAAVGAAATADTRRRAQLLVMLALPATLLAGVGLYSALGVEVNSRRHDIAIGAALGASRARLLREVLRRGLAMAWAGAGTGLLAACDLRSWWLGGPIDGRTIACVFAVMICMTFVASIWPARRILAVEPWHVLRSEA